MRCVRILVTKTRDGEAKNTAPRHCFVVMRRGAGLRAEIGLREERLGLGAIGEGGKGERKGVGNFG